MGRLSSGPLFQRLGQAIERLSKIGLREQSQELAGFE
jgi:hypothetical protein